MSVCLFACLSVCLPLYMPKRLIMICRYFCADVQCHQLVNSLLLQILHRAFIQENNCWPTLKTNQILDDSPLLLIHRRSTYRYCNRLSCSVLYYTVLYCIVLSYLYDLESDPGDCL